ncbi:hypothetical protein [Cytobacillus oceanisediminis]|uniref:hypothetical protein n=1 Tax=Cytobacillus oceanisediminis TaxID=665099 RepID=UPI001C23AB15|nr:hypothetical protein [Cytobacillus oceanisediminis]MBU8771552.1 hypothetical protein [Cytobacillus oceanisediminis]
MEKILNEILSTLKEHSKRFDSVDLKFDSIDQRFDSVDQKFDSIDQRFDSADQKFDSIDQRFDSIDHDISDVNSRLGNVENSIDTVDNKLGIVENSIERLSEQIENNVTEFRSHFKHIETKLEQHEETFNVISDAIKGTKIDIVHLSEKSGVHEMEINQLKKRVHS